MWPLYFLYERELPKDSFVKAPRKRKPHFLFRRSPILMGGGQNLASNNTQRLEKYRNLSHYCGDICLHRTTMLRADQKGSFHLYGNVPGQMCLENTHQQVSNGEDPKTVDSQADQRPMNYQTETLSAPKKRAATMTIINR